MATATLTLAATAFGPTASAGVGSFVGALALGVGAAAVGSYIDQEFIFPLLTDSGKQPKLGELDLSTADEGAPITLHYGALSRGPANLIWTTEPLDDTTGGGTGKRQEQAQRRRLLTGAYLTAGNQIAEHEKVWGDGKLLYVKDNNVTVDGNWQTTFTFDWESVWQGGGANLVRWHGIFENTDGTIDFSQFLPEGTGASDRLQLENIIGQQYQTTNLEILSAEDLGGGTTRMVVDLTAIGRSGPYGPPFSFTPPAQTPIRDPGGLAPVDGTQVFLIQDFPQWRADLWLHPEQAKIFSIGSPTQGGNSVIDGAKGETNAHMYRGSALWAFDRMDSSSFGSRYPNVNVMVEGFHTTLSEVAEQLVALSDVPDTDIDTTRIVGFGDQGYSVQGFVSAAQAMQPWLIARDLVVEELAGTLRFMFRSQMDEMTIPPGDTDARPEFDAPRDQIAIKDREEAGIPKRYIVRARDSGNDAQPMVGQSPFPNGNDATAAVEEVNLLNVTMDSEGAHDLARRLQRISYDHRQQVTVVLPPRYLTVNANTILNIGTATDLVLGDTWRLRVLSVDFDPSYRCRCECVVENADPVATVNLSPSIDPPAFAEERYSSLPVATEIVDIGSLRDTEIPRRGYYVAVTPFDRTRSYAGAALFRSLDGGDSWERFETAPAAATMGYVTGAAAGALEPPPDPFPQTPAPTAPINVALWHGTLASVTDAQIANGANTCVIGDEVLQFKTAVLQADGTYNVSDFVNRGKLQTDGKTTGHVPTERFFLLDDAVTLIEFEEIDWGKELQLRAVPSGASVDDVTSLEVTIAPADEFYTVHPFDITGLTATDIGDGVLLEWYAVGGQERDWYEIRRGDWWTGAPVVARENKRWALLKDIPSGTRTYQVAAHHEGGLYSGELATATINYGGPDGTSILAELTDLTASAAGTLSDCTYDATNLRLQMDPDVFQATYTTDEIDIGKIANGAWALEVDFWVEDTSTTPAEFDARGGSSQEQRWHRGIARDPSESDPGAQWDKFGSEPFAAPADWYGYGQVGSYGDYGRVLIEVRFDLDGLGSWTPYATFEPGHVTAQKAQIRLTIDRASDTRFQVYTNRIRMTARN